MRGDADGGRGGVQPPVFPISESKFFAGFKWDLIVQNFKNLEPKFHISVSHLKANIISASSYMKLMTNIKHTINLLLLRLPQKVTILATDLWFITFDL